MVQKQAQQGAGSTFGGFGPISEDGGLHKSFDGLSLTNSVAGCGTCPQRAWLWSHCTQNAIPCTFVVYRNTAARLWKFKASPSQSCTAPAVSLHPGNLASPRRRRPEYAVSGSGGTADTDHPLSSSRSSAGGEGLWPHSSLDGSLGGATPRRSGDGPSLFADHRYDSILHRHCL